MPRAQRLLEENQYHHVLIKSDHSLFQEEQDYERYMQLFRIAHKYHGLHFSLIHFCFLPKQIHLLIYVIKSDSFQRFIKIQNQRYFYYYQRRYGFKGHLFNGRYQTLPITCEDQLLECGRYIERQPVQRGLASEPSQYLWSSYAYYTGTPCPLNIEPSPMYLQLSQKHHQRKKRYAHYLKQVRPCDGLLGEIFNS